MEKEGTVETQKAAYDAVDGQESIRESEIRMLITQYGKLRGKERMVRVAGMLANQLITVVGVETYNDLRNVTFEICLTFIKARVRHVRDLRGQVRDEDDRRSTAGEAVWHPSGATG